MKIAITLENLKNLAKTAKEAGTLNLWADLMLDWAEQAETEVNRLTELLEKAKGE